ncbi:hypothetical protein H2248_011973 [Termitomyces sp. 'cryptogamus']|nr:hypothetical protein H2248_011973 [Termitomyces sp. 'cryptogamus']
MLIYRPATLFLVFSAPAILAANVQNPNLQLPPDAVVQKAAVKKIFTDSFAAYKKFAFGHDDLSPLSQSFSDGRNGWGASIVDAMSTMARTLSWEFHRSSFKSSPKVYHGFRRASGS